MGFISNLAPFLNYLRRRSPAPPFPPDSRQAGERGANRQGAVASSRSAPLAPRLAPFHLLRPTIRPWPRRRLRRRLCFPLRPQLCRLPSAPRHRLRPSALGLSPATARSCGGFENTSQKLLNVDTCACTTGLSESSAAVGTVGVGGRAPSAASSGWSARKRCYSACSHCHTHKGAHGLHDDLTHSRYFSSYPLPGLRRQPTSASTGGGATHARSAAAAAYASTGGGATRARTAAAAASASTGGSAANARIAAVGAFTGMGRCAADARKP